MAQEIGVPMCIAVTDESGNLIAFERMDGGKVTSALSLAIDKSLHGKRLPEKARKALGRRQSARHACSWHQPRPSAGAWWPVAGGLPCSRLGTMSWVRIGVSAGSPAQDHGVAQAGLEAFNKTQNNF